MITVVTVCLNSANDLERTIQSVLMQVDCDVEYIIKDGGSLDHTSELIEKNRAALEKLASFQFLSSKDNGLYDAMNIAAQQAKGEMVLFLNSGDCLYDKNVLSTIQKKVDGSDVIYGNMMIRDGKRQHLSKAVNLKDLFQIREQMVFGHPAAFIKTALMKEQPYDTQFKLAADYNFFLNAYLKNKKFKYIDQTICFFELGGLSYQRAFEIVDEVYRIKNGCGVISNQECARLRKRNQFKKLTRRLLPPKLYAMLKKWKKKQEQKNWDVVDGKD